MVQLPNGAVLLGTLDSKIEPVEVPGIGKGFKKDYIFPKPEDGQISYAYKHDIGQVANGLAEALTRALKFKHTPVPDTLSKTPMFSVVEDILFRTRYVIFGGTTYVRDGQTRGVVVIVQDDTCNYDFSLLENFVNSL